MNLLAFAALLALAVAAWAGGKKPPADTRAEFFRAAKAATLYGDGRTFPVQDCCGVGDATRVRILRPLHRAGRLYGWRVEVTDPMRHKGVRTGARFTVLLARRALSPAPPAELGNVLFVDRTGTWVYCFMPQAGG